MTDMIQINSVSEMHAILGFDKPSHPLVAVFDYSQLPCMEKMTMNQRYSVGLYSISLKQCAAQLLYGRSYVDFQEGTLMCMSPNQVVTPTSGENERAEGMGLFFHPDLIRRSALGQRIHEYTFFSYDMNEALHLSDKEKKTILGLFEKIKEEYSMNLDDYSHDVIVSNIELLLNYCKRFYGRQFLTRSAGNKDTVAQFEQWLIDYMNSDQLALEGMPSVKQCAEQVHLSPNYLSDLLRKETGKTTQEHVHAQLLELAKNHLLSSSQTVSEVAYQLGFDYPQHFSKFFKNKMGLSPSQYRSVH